MDPGSYRKRPKAPELVDSCGSESGWRLPSSPVWAVAARRSPPPPSRRSRQAKRRLRFPRRAPLSPIRAAECPAALRHCLGSPISAGSWLTRRTNLSYCAGFATGSAGKLLVAWDSGLSPGSITVLDVSSGRPVILVSKREENLGNLVDAAVGPGGDKLVTASGAPYEFDQWNLSTA